MCGRSVEVQTPRWDWRRLAGIGPDRRAPRPGGRLEDRRIPYRRVGNRRKLLLTDLLDYKRKDDEYRRRIADELTQEAQDLGLDD